MTYDTEGRIRWTAKERNLVPHGKLAGSKWDHNADQLRFKRQQALYVPLERTAPVRGSWQDWLAGAFLLFFMVTVIVLSLAA